MQTSTDNSPLNTRLHNPGNTLPAVQTGTENDSRRNAWRVSRTIVTGRRVERRQVETPEPGEDSTLLTFKPAPYSGGMGTSSKERTALIGVLAVLGLIPVASGTTGMAFGTRVLPGGSPTAGSIDSEYRFINVFWTAAGGVLWWSLRKPEKRFAVTRLILALAAFGGVPRLLSWARTGAPHPIFRATILLELIVVPTVLVWHKKVIGSIRK
ncbi:hypothetical protein ACFDR8_003155 [Arthrobacter sp. MP_2.3]